MNDFFKNAMLAGQTKALADYGIKTAEGLGDYYDQAVDWTADRIGDVDNYLADLRGSGTWGQSGMSTFGLGDPKGLRGGLAGGNSLRHKYEQGRARNLQTAADRREAKNWADNYLAPLSILR